MPGVRDFKELICWRLSHELKCEIFEWTRSGSVSRDFKFRDQIVDSSASAPRNIAEGFGRYHPREFAGFLRYARASLMETLNHLIDGKERGYIADPLYSRLYNLARAARRLTTRLMLAKLRQATSERERRRRGTPRRSR
jgi:four helix bundle protein